MSDRETERENERSRARLQWLLLPPPQQCLLLNKVFGFDWRLHRARQPRDTVHLCFMSNYPGYPTKAQLFISTTSNSGANVNVTTPLYDPDFLESIVVQRAQVVKVRASYYTDEG